jgi:hypothetical protein
MWQARALERSLTLNIGDSTLMRSADIVTGALGSDWLEKQRLLTMRPDKYESTLLELALAHRWKKAGAAVTLQPPVPGGVSDFAAVIR